MYSKYIECRNIMKIMTLNIPLTFTVRSNVGLSMSMLRMYILNVGEAAEKNLT